MLQIDWQVMIIIALLAFIAGMLMGIMLTHPRYPYRASGVYRQRDWNE
jgi:uncharacterized integral membrane protein